MSLKAFSLHGLRVRCLTYESLTLSALMIAPTGRPVTATKAPPFLATNTLELEAQRMDVAFAEYWM